MTIRRIEGEEKKLLLFKNLFIYLRFFFFFLKKTQNKKIKSFFCAQLQRFYTNCTSE